MATVSILLIEKKGGHYINLRLTHQRKSVYVSLGFKVDPSQFKPKALSGWVNKSHPDAFLLNAAIERKRHTAVRLISNCEMNGVEIDLNHIAAVVKGKAEEAAIGVSFLKAITDRANHHYANNSTGSYYKYKVLRKAVEAAWNRDYSPDQITREVVEKFQRHRKKNGAHDNTIRKDLSFLATVFETVSKLPNPFREIKIVPVPTWKEKLTKDEITALENAELTGLPDIARDMFLFSYYAQGMRFQNVSLMESNCISNGRLVYQMNKGKKHREIEAHPKLLAIVDKYKGRYLYLFPVIKSIPITAWQLRDIVGSANALINEHLKIAAASAEIDKNLTFHMARHSFSYRALQHGASYAVLKDALGHSDFRTTQVYLDSLSDDHINEAVRGMFD